MDMSKYLHTSERADDSDETALYDMIGVVYHSGSSFGGHYTAIGYVFAQMCLVASSLPFVSWGRPCGCARHRTPIMTHLVQMFRSYNEATKGWHDFNDASTRAITKNPVVPPKLADFLDVEKSSAAETTDATTTASDDAAAADGATAEGSSTDGAVAAEGSAAAVAPPESENEEASVAARDGDGNETTDSARAVENAEAPAPAPAAAAEAEAAPAQAPASATAAASGSADDATRDGDGVNEAVVAVAVDIAQKAEKEAARAKTALNAAVEAPPPVEVDRALA